MKLWLDDIRDPPDESWEWAQSFSQMIWLLKKFGRPEIMSFDHDLGIDQATGTNRSGHDIIKWIAERDQNGGEWYPLEVRVHSANPVGAENVRKYDEWYRKMIGG